MRPLGHGGAQSTTEHRSDIMDALTHMAMASRCRDVWPGKEPQLECMDDAERHTEYLKEILYLLQ